MEVHSHGLDALGVNKEANKVYSPELKDIGVPTSSQIPAGENFVVHTAVDTAAVNVNEELPNAGVESNTTPNSGFSFPPASAAFNTSPDISFQPFNTAETGQDSQQEINEVPGQGVAFDDMVILENDVVTSATVGEGAGHSHDEFHATDVEMEEFHEAPVSDIYNDFSIPADDAAPEDYVDETALDAAGELPEETTVTLTSDVTVVTTVVHEVMVVEPKEAVTDEAATDLPVPVDEPPPAPNSEDVVAKVPDATEDPVVDSIAVDVDTAQKSEPAGETTASQVVISEEEVLAIKGQKVLKKFGRKTFPGEVVDYDPETKWFKVVYEDGDDEDLELSEVKEILVSSTKKKRSRMDGDADDEVSGKTTKKPRKTGSASTAKKSRSESDSAVKSPKTPRSKAKFPKSSRKSSVSKKVKSPGKPIKKSLNSTAFKTPAKSDVKEEKGKGKVATVTPKTKSGSSKKKCVKASRNLNLQSPKSQRTVKSKPSAESSSSKVAKASGSKRKVSRGETSTEKSKRPRKAAIDAGGDIDLVGKQVRKDFDGSLYDGTVVNFDKKTQFYKVKYADGDQEDLELHEIEPILVQDLSGTDEKDDKPAKLSSLSSLMSAGTRKRK